MKKFDFELVLDLKCTCNEVASLLKTSCENSADVRMVNRVLDAIEELLMQGGDEDTLSKYEIQ